MKKLYYAGLIALALFEILNVYFIMPMPGSQQRETLDVAYFLYSNRLLFRGLFLILILLGARQAFQTPRPWLPIVSAIPVLVIVYFFNYQMTADHMFLQPTTLGFRSKAENTLSDSSLVIAVSNGREAKAYPIRYIQYHHQVRDSLGTMPIMVTYCNVCRTGRVFQPTVNGQDARFRLVGMDHFNAMFEDHITRSWWRQATGEAVAGVAKGAVLPEVQSTQLTLQKFFHLYPFGKVMQEDVAFKDSYDTLGRFEKGKSRGDLTRTDTASWNAKSWVVGIAFNGHAKVYDWNQLRRVHIIHDNLGNVPIVVVLASDNQTFAGFQRPADVQFTLQNDSLISTYAHFDLAGKTTQGTNLMPLPAYQEFWHSWKQFHPDTEVYK
jgi:hypothetical protein